MRSFINALYLPNLAPSMLDTYNNCFQPTSSLALTVENRLWQWNAKETAGCLFFTIDAVSKCINCHDQDVQQGIPRPDCTMFASFTATELARAASTTRGLSCEMKNLCRILSCLRYLKPVCVKIYWNQSDYEMSVRAGGCDTWNNIYPMKTASVPIKFVVLLREAGLLCPSLQVCCQNREIDESVNRTTIQSKGSAIQKHPWLR